MANHPGEADEINIEDIMQEIRQQILAQNIPAGDAGGWQIPIGGSRFSPEFYDHLYQAGLAINEMHIHLQVSRTAIPFIGPLLDRFRAAIHQVVLFYVHQAVERQAEVNRHLIQALGILAQELDQEEAPANNDD
jgi:hypothetical protein